MAKVDETIHTVNGDDIKHSDNTSFFEQDILKENTPKLSYIVKFFSYVFSSAKVMCGIFLSLAIILSILQPITALLWGKYIDGATNYAQNSHTNTNLFTELVVILILYWFTSFINNLLNRYLYGSEDIERLSKVQDHRLQEKFCAKLFKKISLLYPDYMEVPKINEMISRSFSSIAGEYSSLQRGVIIQGYVIIAKTISVIIVASSLYIFHPILCFIVLAAPIPTLYTTFIGNELRFRFSRDNSKILRQANYYQNILLNTSAKEVKVLNLFDFFFDKWQVLADDYVIKEKKNLSNIFAISLASSFVTNIVGISANVFAIVLTTQGTITIGSLAAVLALNGTLMGSTSQLFSSIASFISKKNETAQFFEFIDLQEQLHKISTEFEKVNLEKIETIQTKNLCYRYPLTDEYKIKNVDFTIEKGQKIAFVGANGAGKTTFVKLITGLLQPSSGDVFVNNINANNLDYKDKYSALSLVLQQSSKFTTFTISDNVFFGDVHKERNEEQIDNALSFAGFSGHDKNSKLGKDIGGTDLSGGQWQKLAIARSYYRNKDFIVLDEPTSNLDPIAETEVLKKYLEMTKGNTVILITHRMSVASIADKIVVFKDGEIVETGTHEELISNNAEYASLYSVQSQWYDR